MEKTRNPNPAVKFLVIAIFIVFFGGGLLIFVNNMIVRFLPERAMGILGLVVMAIFIIMLVAVKCASAVTRVRRIDGAKACRDETQADDSQ